MVNFRGGSMKESLALIALFRLTFSSYGQLATITALVGTVSDSSGKAKIPALDKATLDKYSGITNQDGNYRIDFVRVGTYDVSAEYPGFQTMRHAGSIVNTNSIVRKRPDLLKKPVYNCGAGHLIGCIDKSAFAVPGNIAQGIFAYGNASPQHPPQAPRA
jgi:hypothetical protein